MKNTSFLFLCLLICEISLAQNSAIVKHNYSVNDTIPEVVKPDSWEIDEPLFEINNKFTSTELTTMLKGDDIESLQVVKGNFNFNGKNYEGKIKLILKPNVKVNLITVAELISKYTKLKDSENYIYSIDGKLIMEDAKSALIDEKNVMQMKVFPIDYLKNYPNFSLVKILTRTEKNISKANEILIR